MMENVQDRIIGGAGGVSGFASVLGSWQICHNVCLGIIAALSLIGISLVGMPLIFLTKLALPFWTVAFLLLLVIIWFYFSKRCISNRLILFNSGLIIAGVPFAPVQPFLPYFWTVGGIVAGAGASLYLKDKLEKRRGQSGREN